MHVFLSFKYFEYEFEVTLLVERYKNVKTTTKTKANKKPSQGMTKTTETSCIFE